MNLLETESYSDVLANGRRRKRPKLGSGVNDLSSLLASAEVKQKVKSKKPSTSTRARTRKAPIRNGCRSAFCVCPFVVCFWSSFCFRRARVQ